MLLDSSSDDTGKLYVTCTKHSNTGHEPHTDKIADSWQATCNLETYFSFSKIETHPHFLKSAYADIIFVFCGVEDCMEEIWGLWRDIESSAGLNRGGGEEIHRVDDWRSWLN